MGEVQQAERSHRCHSERSEWAQFQRSARVRSVPITEATAERYAQIYAYLRAARRPVPANDLWIAAAAMEQGAPRIWNVVGLHFSESQQLVDWYHAKSGRFKDLWTSV